MYINQLINEMSVPILVYGLFSVINVNAAGRELFQQSKSHLLNKYIFDLIHPEDIPNFVKNSVESLVDFKEMERIKVRVLASHIDNNNSSNNTSDTSNNSSSACWRQCVLTETIHKNQNGIPLFSSIVLMRIDDCTS